ncbi:hypothetical protein L6706_004651 [Salmonella enterica]|nr:hypothetical protein [Salmonella enterica]EKZ3297848.1 hypothetical protein [Salmonella enterica]
MSKKSNLSTRYIDALRRLPQYTCNTDMTGPLTHVMTGVRVLPVDNLADDEDSGLLEIQYPGGHKIVVYAALFFDIALKEAAEIEVNLSSDENYIFGRKQTAVQRSITYLREHLERKYSLND